MASKLALVELRPRILKRLLEGDKSNSPRSMGSGDQVFTSAFDTFALKIHPPKKQKGKKIAKEKKIIQVDPEDSPNLEGKSEISVLAKDFPYPEFMDKKVMIPALLEQLRGDDDGLIEKFQWVYRMLLKSVALLTYSDSVISSGVRAIQEFKELEERISLLQKEKLALEKAKQAEVEELRGQVRSKDQ